MVSAGVIKCIFSVLNFKVQYRYCDLETRSVYPIKRGATDA